MGRVFPDKPKGWEEDRVYPDDTRDGKSISR
jgi:hypothetical protein